MPLDGHSYLVSQGWGGKGTGLRQGAISRPIAIPKKKNLAGLGKDRDEAFPFWDHLFSAASKSIKVYCSSDEEGDSEDGASSSNEVSLKRTSTGILSTRRPVVGQTADSGTSTPSDESNANTPRLSLMAQAKRDAAKRGLYSKFFRGPVLGPAEIAKEEERLTALVNETFAKAESAMQSVTIKEHIEVQTVEERVMVDLEVSKTLSKKKRKQKDLDLELEGEGDDAAAAEKERKRRRKEEKRKRKEEERDVNSSSSRKEKKEKGKHKKDKEAGSATDDLDRVKSSSKVADVGNSASEDEKEQRRRRKEEKKKLKENKRLGPEVATDIAGENSSGSHSQSPVESSQKKSRKTKSKNERTGSLEAEVEQAQDKKKKKKRK